MRWQLICFVIATMLAPAAASGQVKHKIGIAQGGAVLFDRGGVSVTDASTRISYMAIVPVGDGVNLVVKPRLLLPYSKFLQVQPGMIVGAGGKVHEDVVFGAGVLYQPNLPYDDRPLTHLVSVAVGPTYLIDERFALSWAVAAGKIVGKWAEYVDGPWTLASQIELQIALP